MTITDFDPQTEALAEQGYADTTDTMTPEQLQAHESLATIHTLLEQIKPHLHTRLPFELQRALTRLYAYRWMRKVGALQHHVMNHAFDFGLSVGALFTKCGNKSEDLTKQLFALDQVLSYGNPVLKAQRKAMVVEVHQLLKISDGLIEDAKLMKQRVKKFLPESRTPTASPASSPPASPAKAPMEDPMEEDLDEGTDSGSDSDSDNYDGRYNHEEAQDETKEHALPELDEDEEDDDDGDEDGSLPKWQPKYQFTHGQRALQVYLPGVAPQDVRFNLTAGRGSGKMLTIRGIKRPTTQQWHTFQHRQQLHQQQWGTPLDTAEFGRFEVNLELGRGVVDAKNISCSMDPMRGVLTVDLPRKQHQQQKQRARFPHQRGFVDGGYGYRRAPFGHRFPQNQFQQRSIFGF